MTCVYFSPSISVGIDVNNLAHDFNLPPKRIVITDMSSQILTEALSDSLIKRYNNVIDSVEGIVNAFSAKGMEELAQLLKPALEKTKSELVTMSDASRDRGFSGFVKNLFGGDKSTALQNLEKGLSDLDNSARQAYKYAKALLSRNQQASAVKMAELELEDSDKKKLLQLLTNAFKASSSRVVRKSAVEIANSVYENLTLDDLKSLATELDGIAEVVRSESDAILQVNKKLMTTPPSEDKEAKKARAAGQQLGIDTQDQALAQKMTSKVEKTPGKGDDIQMALNILAKLNDAELKAVITLIKRMKA